MPQPSRQESPLHPTPKDEPMAALRRSRASVHSLLEISPELALVHREGRVTYVNPATVRALGLQSGEELVGSPIDQVFHADDRSVVDSRLVAPPANSTHDTFGLRWRARGGTYR